ncbi:TrkH family potassium uptake protein [Aureivirga sp. CE67]|uniref:TrkH family potassium uptake protein n=1 Tax=Aureivirga sp. CE67 TaxID=1788983 RepID=UPI0018CBE303|nr:potassium transporter TrkG [Aureivirga sp. CE67]
MKSSLFSRLVKNYKKIRVKKSPQVNLVWGFFVYTLIGFLIISIPFLQKTDISVIDNLFTASSAVSTTGLATVNILESYTLIGQIWILIMIQIGGIGYMTLTTYVLLLTSRKITNWHAKIMNAEFTTPKSMKIKDFLISAFYFTVSMEVIGSIVLYFCFKAEGMDVLKAIWYSIFHSISAFCTAGFSLTKDSFIGFQGNYIFNGIIAFLSIAGSLGFIVVTDLWFLISRRTKKITYTSKLILLGFLGLLFFGTIMIYFSESGMEIKNKDGLLIAFFQAMSAMTTVGFNTVPIGQLSMPILLLITMLMYIGASPSGTAGGLKITTLFAMVAILKSRLFGQETITLFWRKIPFERLYVATSIFILYTSLIFLFTFLLTYTEKFNLQDLLFETASALGTVGLSTGITSGLSTAGKLMMILLMFIGRVGVLTFGFAFLKRREDEEQRHKKEDLAV